MLTKSCGPDLVMHSLQGELENNGHTVLWRSIHLKSRCHGQPPWSQSVAAQSIHIPKMLGSHYCSRPSRIMGSRKSAHMALMRLGATQWRVGRSVSWAAENLAHSINSVMGTERTSRSLSLS